MKPDIRSSFPRTVRWACATIATALSVVMLFGDAAFSQTRRPARNGAQPRATTAAASQSALKSPQHSKKLAPKKLGEYNPDDETVDMFEALEAGEIAVKFIPKDSTEGRVFIHNKADKPLNVKLPAAFAAAPVLAQMGGGQGMGGGGGMRGGMGMMNVPADKELNVRVPCVCLEHGKPEPRPQMAYEIKPLNEFTEKPGVAELLKRLGEGKIGQRAAQAAAWHLNNDMSWTELAQKRIDYLNGASEPYFSFFEIQQGMAAATQSLAETKKSSEPRRSSPGETSQRDQ